MKPVTFMLVVLLLSVFTIGPTSPDASTVIPMDLRQCVEFCGLAFAGTVSDVRMEWTPSHETIVTRVSFTHIAIAKGAHADSTLVLTLEGGRVGPEEVIVSGHPRFEVGHRYVVLADADLGSADNSYIPIFGLYQCYFTVGEDSSGSDDVVRDWAGRQLVAIRNGHAVVLDNQSDADVFANYRRPKQTSGVRDLYVPGRRESIGPDSLEGGQPTQMPVPEKVDQRPRAVRPYHRPTKRYPVPKESPVPREIVSAKLDPGTRVHESQFLEAIRGLSAK